MSVAFLIPTIHVCQNGWQWAANCRSWALAHWSLLRGKKLWWRKMFACWVKTRIKWKGKQGLSSSEGQNKHQTTQSHHCWNVVLGRLRDGGMASPHIHTTTIQLSNGRTPSLDGGQLTEDNREERGLSLLFHHHDCKASTSLQALFSLQVSVPCSCVSVYNKCLVHKNRKVASLKFTMYCFSTRSLCWILKFSLDFLTFCFWDIPHVMK